MDEWGSGPARAQSLVHVGSPFNSGAPEPLHKTHYGLAGLSSKNFGHKIRSIFDVILSSKFDIPETHFNHILAQKVAPHITGAKFNH